MEELAPDARGFKTFLVVVVENNTISSTRLDARNGSENPYGTFKESSEKYNNDMYAESGTYYRDAVKILEKEILENKYPLIRVKGARYLSQDANVLFGRIRESWK